MPGWGHRIKNLRKDRGYKTQGELGKAIGVSHVSVSGWEREEFKPDGDNLYDLLAVLGVSKQYLYTGVEGDDKEFKPKIEVRQYPLVRWDSLTKWSIDKAMDNHAVTFESAPYSASKGSFIVKVENISMLPEFAKGDLILVDPNEKIQTDKYVIVNSDSGSALFKKLTIEDNIYMLHSINPDWPSKYQVLESPSNIIGVVVGKWKAY